MSIPSEAANDNDAKPTLLHLYAIMHPQGDAHGRGV